jgi:chloride channel protein, CIC family
MEKKTVISGILIWIIKNMKHRQLLLSLSFIIGLVSGLAAVVLKNTVYYTNEFLTGRLAVETGNLIYLAFPATGIFLTVLFTRYLIKDQISHGVTKVLHSISRKDSVLAPHNSFSSMIASTMTVGFGGSVGLEAPIVLTGSSIGSNLGRFLKLDYRSVTLLIACGATGAIAGIFKSPIAAMIFSLEVLMLDLTMWSIIPLLIAAVTGATIATLLLGPAVVFDFTIPEPFMVNSLPWYILLGILCGLVSFYFTWGSMKVEARLQKISSPYHRLFYGGLILGLLIYVFPPLYGEGYDTLRALLGGVATEIAAGSLIATFRDHYWVFIGFLVLILVFKVIAMAATTGSGGVGGIFAPSLYMGGITGFITASLINNFAFINVSERNFALVGMAGVMSGVMHAPLTAIFLIAEITGGYELFIPLIVTSTIAYITIIYFEPHSIYTKRLAARGELITHHKDKAVLTLFKMGQVIETDLKTVPPGANLGELVKIVSKSKRNMFPVVDEKNNLLGIVLLDNIREIIFKPAQYEKIKVTEIMDIPPATVSPNENMASVMKKFEDSGAWNLPVLDNKKYVGYISKSKIFSEYRKILMQFSSE